MCFFVTCTLPSEDDRARLGPVIARHGMAFNPVANASIAGDLTPGESQYHASGSCCDCATIIGAGQGVGQGNLDKQLLKARKKGWSEAKIQRWLAQLDLTLCAKERALHAAARSHDATTWVSFLNEMLADRKCRFVGLLLHWYSGRLEEEEIHINSCQRAEVAAVDGEFLTNVQPDVLWRITRPVGRPPPRSGDALRQNASR